MKILKCLNTNYLEPEKNSFNFFNNFTSRIKRIKTDVNNFQKNDNFSFSSNLNKKRAFNLNNINSISTCDELLDKFGNSKESFRTCCNTDSNGYIYNIYNKKINQKRYFKKLNNYNNIILNKKNILLNLKSSNNNKNITVFSDEEKSLPKNNKIKKGRSLFSFDATFLDNIQNENKTKLLKSNHSHINELDYKFEIIQYKKKLESLKNQKQEKINKIKEMNQANNKIYENKIKEINSKPLDDIILLLKNKYYSNAYLKNYFSSENILLNIMDLKYSFEKNKLTNQFFEGINQILKINDSIDYNDILAKLNELIDSKNNFINTKNKCNYLLKENQKYFYYINSLLNKFQITEISELFNYIKSMHIKSIREADTFEKIKVNLMKDLIKKKPRFLPKNNNKKSSNSEQKKLTGLQNYLKSSDSIINFGASKIRLNSFKSKNRLNMSNSYNIKYKNNNSLGYIMVSNGKDKMIKVNKRKKNENIQKNLFDKIKRIKINNIIDYDRNNTLEKASLSFY